MERGKKKAKKTSNRRVRSWAGGYVRREDDGGETYMIERMVGGERYHRSTGAHTERAAIAQLDRFEANPGAWSAAGDKKTAALKITPEMVIKFRNHKLAPRPLGDGCTSRKHVAQYCTYLTDFMVAFKGKDLRTLTLVDDVKPALVDKQGVPLPCLGYRIAAIKAFYTWLREVEHVLTTAQDCTLDLKSIQASPEKHKRRKAVDLEVVRAVYHRVSPPVRDCIAVLMATGWHFTELERFVRHQANAEIVETPGRADGQIAILRTRQKGLDMTNTAITHKEHLEAAKRLFGRGGKMPKRPNDEVKAACLEAGVPEFTLGVMRHTVTTWAAAMKCPLETIAIFVDHKDKRTTARFYVDHNEPRAIIPTHVIH